MRLLVLAALAGCWTGDEPAVHTTPVTAESRSKPNRAGLRVKLERTACDGACPEYIIVIHGDGRVDWFGKDHVLAVGSRRGRVTDREVSELERELAAVRFFERDEHGHLPVKSECTTLNGTTTCSMGGSFSFCTDTSHTIISVTRKYRTHTIDNANCSDTHELGELEDLIERIANVRAWVGE